MRRLLIASFALVSLTGCFTQLRQSREPVSADCNAWPAPADEGSTLTLEPGQTGRYEDVTILFTELDLNRGRGSLPYYPYYGYGSPYGYGRPPGWRPGWYGPLPRRVLYDLVVLSVCRPENVPTDRKLYLTSDPWYARDVTTVEKHDIAVERLERVRSDDPDVADRWRLTLKVSRAAEPEVSD